MRINDNGSGELEPQTLNVVRIVIELDPATRRMALNANVKDPIVFFGTLEQAKDVFREMMRREQERRVELAPPGLKVPTILPG